MIGDLLPTRTRCALLVGGAALLAACTVDPYTGALVPCCGPAYSGPAGYPASPPGYGSPQGQPGMASAGEAWGGPGPQDEMGPGGGGGGHRGGGHLAQRFAAANVTQDGRLTLQQAEAANWRRVAQNFHDIDVQHKGYVTMDDIRSWRAAHQTGRGGGYRGQGGGYAGQGGGYPGEGGGYPGGGGGYPGGGGGYPGPGGGGYPGAGGGYPGQGGGGYPGQSEY